MIFNCLLQRVSISVMSHCWCNILNSYFYDLLWIIETFISASEYIPINVTLHWRYNYNDLNSCFYDLMFLLWNIDTWLLQEVSIPEMSHCWYVVFWSLILDYFREWVSHTVDAIFWLMFLWSDVSMWDHWYFIISASEYPSNVTMFLHWIFWIHVSMIWCVYFGTLIYLISSASELIQKNLCYFDVSTFQH